jgi:hypothetical protein
MTDTRVSVFVQVFAAPSATCGSGSTWESVTAYLGERLHARFGESVVVEHIVMFTPRSFDFPDVMRGLQEGAELPIVRVGGEIVSSGGKLSESRIAQAINARLEPDSTEEKD